MEKILEHNIATADLKKFEEEYHRHLSESCVTPQLQFEYAWCLVQSCYHGDVAKGILLLTALLGQATNLNDKRDFLFYLAFGHTRLKEYSKACQNLKDLLILEPGNQQAIDLRHVVSSRLRKERLRGAVVAGGTLLAVGGVVGAALSSTTLIGFGCRTLAQLAPAAFTLLRR